MNLSTIFGMAASRVESLGGFCLYLKLVFLQIFQAPFRLRLILQQAEFIGTKSLGIISLSGFFTGAVFGLQTGGIFAIFRTESLLGGATALALAIELAPLVTGFLLAGRVGSSMTAEIATMKVGEQIDAMESMGVDPLHYLVVPRLLASMFVMPLLCGLFMFVGMVGTYCVGTQIFLVDQGVFFEKITFLVKNRDVLTGIRKMFFFSIIMSTICCYHGLFSKGGAKGVGTSTTTAVVKSLICILICDFIISYIEVRWLR
ncbi:MAG: ABC transporter permease [Oligoflexales bacterium]|nr:ABC transporter permease [Oligoflexales bacterium]